MIRQIKAHMAQIEDNHKKVNKVSYALCKILSFTKILDTQ